MSKPKFMVFKLKDLWVPVIVTIFAIVMVVFFVSKLTSTKTTFAPDQGFNDGLYVAEISLDNAEFNVAVSIHKNAIKSVELRNMDEQAKLMYPLFEPSMAYINDRVTKTQSLEIEEFAQAKETTAFLMDAVRNALALPDKTVDKLENNMDTIDNTVDDYILTDPLSNAIDNPEMSDQTYVDWETELDAIIVDEGAADID
ncbi:MAG TPA: hypothetical protein GX707_07485 [Epulopiscium sp.]|nr:hypothetical protein [Candidatus Epulonipiscium sp.]